ncbi:MAG: hypothetical protein ACRDJ9_23105, partial [Dehalococcoidia bacterium]
PVNPDDGAVSPRHCAVHQWHPMIECEGSFWLVRLRHPLVGDASSCLPHAIHAIRVEPHVRISESPGDLSDGIRSRALTGFSRKP